MNSKISLRQLSRFIRRESEKDMDPIDIATVKTDWMISFSFNILILKELVGHVRWSSHCHRPRKTENQKIQSRIPSIA